MSVGSSIFRSGLTLIETLVSLALLSAIAIACAGIAELATSRSAEQAARARWELAARTVLSQIATDLRTGDGPLDPGLFKVTIEANNLLISGRYVERAHQKELGGRLNNQVAYTYAAERGVLVRRSERTVPILSMLAGFSASYDVDRAILAVDLHSTLGPSLHEEFSAR
jgi:Tfp pilus assembly protein PilV